MTTIHCRKALLGIGVGLAFANLWPTSARADDITLCNQANVKPDDGIGACTRLLARPTIEADTILLNRARGWSAKGDLDSAIDDYTSAIQRNPRNTDALLNRGAVWYRKNEYDRAISDFNLILAVKRDHALAFVYRGVALSAKGEFDRAVSDFDQSIRLDSKNPAAYRFRAVAHYRRRDFNRSIDDFNTAIKLAPRDATFYNDRAQVFVDTGKLDLAIADYNQAIRLDPNGWRAYSSRGEARRLKGDLNGALLDHDRAIKLDSSSHDAYINRALAWKDKGDLDKAIADLDEAILLSPSDARALGNRGEVRRLKNDLEGSRADLDNAIKMFQSSTVLFCRRADTWLAIGSFDRAMDDYNQARIISPNALCAHAGRGLVQEKQGDLVAARLEFDKVLKVQVEKDPDPVMGRQAQELAAKRIAAIDAMLEARKPPQPGNLLAEPAIDLGTRVALVIGNSGYEHAGVLANPRRDAEAVAKAFREVGFQQVILEHDLSRAKLLAALGAFEAAVMKADWGVIYYAGHGMELGGVNYVIPTDAKLDTDRDVQDEAVSLERVMASLEHAKKLRLIVLDACRDNPFLTRMRRLMGPATRGPLGRGLASIEPERGTLVAYAAKHGEVASDGDEGQHSPFLRAFLARLQEPRLEINMLFRYVRDDVMKATNYRQEPHTYGTLPAQAFFFKR